MPRATCYAYTHQCRNKKTRSEEVFAFKSNKFCSCTKKTPSFINEVFRLHRYNSSHITNQYPRIPRLILSSQQQANRLNQVHRPNSSSNANSTNPAVLFSLTSFHPQHKKHPSIMCRARITTYRLCGCIQKHIDLCSVARKTSTAMEWDPVYVYSDWDKVSTEVHESVNKRCPSHAREFLERNGVERNGGLGGGR